MLLRLATLTGDATEEQINELVENFTINPPAGLGDPEEKEVARRVLAIWEQKEAAKDIDEEGNEVLANWEREEAAEDTDEDISNKENETEYFKDENGK